MLKRTRDTGAATPVTLEEQKRHLRIAGEDFNIDLQQKLDAAIRRAENWMNMVLVQSTFEQTELWAAAVTLAVHDVTEIASVEIDGLPASAEDYSVSFDKQTITLHKEGEVVKITYKAGVTEVEPDIKAAIMMDCGSLFTNPLDAVEQLPKASQNIYNMYKYGRR